MQQRRKPSPNLPTYKKAILEAQMQGISFADFMPIWSTWDAPYCNHKTARVLWDQTRYVKKYDIGGNGRLPVGSLSEPRPPEQIARIKAAVRDGIGFATFWSSATDWPVRSPREKARVSSLYTYYKRTLVALSVKAIETAPPHIPSARVYHFPTRVAAVRPSCCWSGHFCTSHSRLQLV